MARTWNGKHWLSRTGGDSAGRRGLCLCAVPGCGLAIRAGFLMCHRHWRNVSQQTRREVNSTWQAGYSGDYLAAREKAIEEASAA